MKIKALFEENYPHLDMLLPWELDRVDRYTCTDQVIQLTYKSGNINLVLIRAMVYARAYITRKSLRLATCELPLDSDITVLREKFRQILLPALLDRVRELHKQRDELHDFWLTIGGRFAEEDLPKSVPEKPT